MTADEFLAAKLSETQAELSIPILNRGRWDALCESRRMLVFLRQRVGTADFQGVGAELHRIAEGRLKVPDLNGPRRQAGDCLRHWAKELEDLE